MSINEDPMGADYWAVFEGAQKQIEAKRNERNQLYGGNDPGTWGWSRPAAAEVEAEQVLRDAAADLNTVRR